MATRFTTRSTKESGHIVVEVCSQCHPFYTGKQKILDSGGRVARFEKRYGKRKAGEKAPRRQPTNSCRPGARSVALAQAGRRFVFATNRPESVGKEVDDDGHRASNRCTAG